jgi:hypothetical protein
MLYIDFKIGHVSGSISNDVRWNESILVEFSVLVSLLEGPGCLLNLISVLDPTLGFNILTLCASRLWTSSSK